MIAPCAAMRPIGICAETDHNKQELERPSEWNLGTKNALYKSKNYEEMSFDQLTLVGETLIDLADSLIEMCRHGTGRVNERDIFWRETVELGLIAKACIAKNSKKESEEVSAQPQWHPQGTQSRGLL